MNAPRAALVIVALLTASSAAPARELWSAGDASLEISGSLRELLVGTHATDLRDFQGAAAADPAGCLPAAAFPGCSAFDRVNDAPAVTSLTRLRTRLDFRLDEHWSAVLTYDHELLGGTLDTLGGEISQGISTSSFLDAEWNLINEEKLRWQHLLYRGYVFFESKHVEAVVGRQRIPWGVGRLWNPIDRFNAIPPLQIQGDQSPGVDAVLLRGLFTGFTFLEAVFAPQDHQDDSSYAARLHGVVRDVDYSLVAGRFEEAWTLGFDLAGNLGDAAARLEVVWADPSRQYREIGRPASREVEDFFQVVVSIDHLFDVGTGLYVLVEHLYNGNALGFGHGKAGTFLPLFQERTLPSGARVVAPGSPDRFGGSRVVTFATQQTGLQLGYDVTPEIRAEIISIGDWNGPSASFFPSFRYNPFDWLELTVGGQLFVGGRRSQYGDAEHLGFLLAEVFF